MKKSKLILAVKKVIKKHYGDAGFTNTADVLLKDILKAINRL